MLKLDGIMLEQVEDLLEEQTFVGIDFGTSTTVVSRICVDQASGCLMTEPIPIAQEDRLGRTIEDHILPTCIAWIDDRLLIGRGAAELKSSLVKGRNLWFSFKMGLGIDLGPKYYQSELRGAGKPAEILNDQDAAKVFFAYVREKIELWLKSKGLPSRVRYAVSVPASFEANQRADLCRALEAAGIEISTHGIIDEPNAAFVSHLIESLRYGPAALDPFRRQPTEVLVFDFGAGTCDISILRVSVKDERLFTQNLAISQFRALGGDNIDRRIARQVLWPAMRAACAPGRHFRAMEIEQLILPRLVGCAEQLKVQCCKSITARGNGNSEPFRTDGTKIQCDPVPPFTVDGVRLELPAPTITFAEFFRVMGPFLSEGAYDPAESDGDSVSIFEPILNAIAKSKLGEDELDMVLFIGGSSDNPLVQESIRKHFGRFVECVVTSDPRTPVSRGTALHSLAVNGMGVQLIRAITSETIYVIAAGNRFVSILPAGTPMPSDEVAFTDQLAVQHDGQRVVQLPICVSNRNKLLGIVDLRPSQTRPFQKGDLITVACRMDENKLIQITAKTGSTLAETAFLNPLANEELTAEETKCLMARQKLNEAIIEGGGKPNPGTLEEYAIACAGAGRWIEAAETREALEKISSPHRTGGNATSLCYCFSMAGLEELSLRWGEIAHKRSPTWLSAFNLALGYERSGKKQEALDLFEEAFDLSPENAVVLSAYGQRLLAKGQKERATEMLESALETFVSELESGGLRSNDVSRLRQTARLLKRDDVLERLDGWEEQSCSTTSLFSERLLAISTSEEETINPD
jgi:molecular chaperone DnaK (HSP70)